MKLPSQVAEIYGLVRLVPVPMSMSCFLCRLEVCLCVPLRPNRPFVSDKCFHISSPHSESDR